MISRIKNLLTKINRRRVVNVLKTMPDDNSQGIVELMEPGLDPEDGG